MSPELQRSVTCDYVTTDSAKDLGRAKITEKNKICSNKRRVYYTYIYVLLIRYLLRGIDDEEATIPHILYYWWDILVKNSLFHLMYRYVGYLWTCCGLITICD